MTNNRPKTACITCGKLTNYYTPIDYRVTHVCPECGGDLTVLSLPNRPESVDIAADNQRLNDEEPTENDYVSDCDVCGDPTDYCLGHGEIG